MATKRKNNSRKAEHLASVFASGEPTLQEDFLPTVEAKRNVNNTNPTNLDTAEAFELDFGANSDEDESEQESEEEAPLPKKAKCVWTDETDEQELCEVNQGGVTRQIDASDRKEIHERAFGAKPKWADYTCESDDEDAIVVKGNPKRATTGGPLPPTTLKYAAVADVTAAQRHTKLGRSHFRTQFATSQPHALVTACVARGKDVEKTSPPVSPITLYHLEDTECKILSSIGFSKHPISCSSLFAGDTKLVVAGHFKSALHVHDLQTQQWMSIPWRHDSCPQRKKQLLPYGDSCLMLHEDHGVRLIDTRSAWRPVQQYQGAEGVSNVAVDGETLYTSTYSTGRVTVWEPRTATALVTFSDEGCVHATALAAKGGLLACGSDSGVVNLYRAKDVTSHQLTPQKTFTQLSQQITELAFNPLAEMLFFGSSLPGSDFAKLAHLGSNTVFSNFPARSDGIKAVHHATFSPNGGYLALASKMGDSNCVRRLRLQHYPRY